MTGEALLSVKDLQKSFAGKARSFGLTRVAPLKAVDSVSFEIFPSETLAIIGESGCGKTTTLRMLLLLEQPDAGEIRFRNEQILKLRGRDRSGYRKAVQAVFQDPFSSLSPRMRVGDIVAEPLEANSPLPKRDCDAEVARLLRLVGLPSDAAQRYPHEFSGGQRQRIAIARALSIRPALILLDEPVSALDISIRAQVVNLLQDIQKSEGVSFLLVSHDLPIVRHMSHRTAVMYRGRLIELAPTDQLYRKPLHPYTQTLLSAALPVHPRNRRQRSAALGETAEQQIHGAGCPYRAACPVAIERCAQFDPRLSKVARDRSVACHLAS